MIKRRKTGKAECSLSSYLLRLSLHKTIRYFSFLFLMVLSPTVNTLMADTAKKPKAPSVAKAAGNDQQTFSLIFEPESHPFCEAGENQPAEDRRGESDLRPLLVPESCKEEGGVKKKYDWDLSSDPLVPQGWPAVTSDQGCLDGKADVLLERAYRYGFCNWTEYDIPLSSVKIPDKNFVLTQSDYYAIHIVVWKADETFDETKAVSSFHGIDPDSEFFVDSEVTITTTDPETGSTIQRSYEFKPGACTRDVLSTMSVDLKTKDGAKVEEGQMVISLPPHSSVKGTGLLTTWVNPIKSVSYKVGSSKWYTYNRGDHRRFRQPLPLMGSSSLRIYGTKRPIGLVAVHIRPTSEDGVEEHDRELWQDFQKLKVKYQISVQKKVAANIADLNGAVSIIFNKTGGATAATPVKGTKTPEGLYGATFFKAKAPSDITVDVQIDFPTPPKENPVPTKNKAEAVTSVEPFGYHLDSVSIGASKQSSAVNRPSLINTAYKIEFASVHSDASQTSNPQQPTAGSGSNPPKTTTKTTGQSPKGGTQDQTPTAPSVDCQPSTGNSQQSACKMEAKYDAEDLYHWDISFGVPFKSLKELTYGADTGNGSIVPKTVKRQYAYVFADIYPIAADIVSPPWITMPHVMAGLPISGKVFNKPIFAIGDGFNLKKLRYLNAIPLQVQFFGGVAFNKEFRQIPGTTGSSNVAPHRVWSGIYGIEIPVSQFKGLLGSKNNSTNQPSSKNPSTGTGGQSN